MLMTWHVCVAATFVMNAQNISSDDMIMACTASEIRALKCQLRTYHIKQFPPHASGRRFRRITSGSSSHGVWSQSPTAPSASFQACHGVIRNAARASSFSWSEAVKHSMVLLRDVQHGCARHCPPSHPEAWRVPGRKQPSW